MSRTRNITSERLKLRPFAGSDADDLLGVFQDPGVRRYLLDDALVSAEWIEQEIRASEKRFAEGRAGLWSILPVDGRRIVGFAGFREFFDPPELQLIYGLLPEVWGQGWATEAARRVCDVAFGELGFTEVLAAIDIPNQASGKVLERLGLSRTRITDDGVAGTAFYRIDRKDWRLSQG